MPIEQRAFGPGGLKVPVIGQGTWKMEADDRTSAVAALQHGIDIGLTHIDTAELYGGGRVEQNYVAEAIAGRRDQVFLVSKVRPENATYEGTLRACENSLRRLRTDHLDCYLLHWPGRHPLDQTIRGFEKLVADGKIRSWGVSNFDVSDLDEAWRIAGKGRIACNQVVYHLQAREIEARVLPWCAAHGVTLVGYSPFGSGDFPPPSSRGGRVLAEIGRKHGTSAHEVALAFLVRDPHAVSIPKAAKSAHVDANRHAAEVKLSPEEIRQIDEAFPATGGPLTSL
jgi:diketogulonate reductase-like aldo/keto reductase